MMAHNAAAQLQKPCYDSIAAIDDRLAQLERETSMMEQKYAFIKQAGTTMTDEKADVGKVIDAREQGFSSYNPHQSNFLSGIDKAETTNAANSGILRSNFSQTKLGMSTQGFSKESRYNNLPTIDGGVVQAPQKSTYMNPFQSDIRNEISQQKSQLGTVPKAVTLRPQITKEYVAAQTEGKPDFSILATNY